MLVYDLFRPAAYNGAIVRLKQVRRCLSSLPVESSNTVLGTKRCRNRQIHDIAARHGERPVSRGVEIQRHRTNLV